jgi:hypothetical protein
VWPCPWRRLGEGGGGRRGGCCFGQSFSRSLYSLWGPQSRQASHGCQHSGKNEHREQAQCESPPSMMRRRCRLDPLAFPWPSHSDPSLSYSAPPSRARSWPGPGCSHLLTISTPADWGPGKDRILKPGILVVCPAALFLWNSKTQDVHRALPGADTGRHAHVVPGVSCRRDREIKVACALRPPVPSSSTSPSSPGTLSAACPGKHVVRSDEHDRQCCNPRLQRGGGAAQLRHQAL